MATRNRGRFVWYEHLTRDVGAAIKFYSEVVGWKTQKWDQAGGEYTMWVGSQGPLGGVMAPPAPTARAGGPPFWMGHVQVDDVDAAASLVKRRGGTVWREPTDIPTVGRFAVIADPQGASLSLFTPTQEMTLHDPSRDGEICWNELITSDSAAAVGFYTELCGWKILDEMDMGPMGKYRVFGVGDVRVGGMMTAPPGSAIPPSWGFYVSTSDLDAAMARATRSGAKVLNGPENVPGGRIAQLLDPQGAMFALHQAAPAAG